MNLVPRDDEEEIHTFVNPYTELNIGLWSLFASASIFLALRVWVKLKWQYGLWYDDYILLLCWCILLANNSLIVHEFATGYVLKDSAQKWDDRMHILINITSCGTLIGQAWTKTAFGVTLLRISNGWQKHVIWFCIATMNIWMISKVIFQWAKVCGKDNYQNWYRLDFCIGPTFRDDFKEGGNVWNIIMDFVFAIFPWILTYKVAMRRVERIGLCLTMSLGVIVAIVSAIRVGWKDDGNDRDKWYIWRNGLSQVWYSSEITGTILVQCIPVLRPILRNFSTSWASNKRASADARSSLKNRFSARVVPNERNYDTNFKPAESLSLERIKSTEDPEWQRGRRLSVVVDYDEDGRKASVESWPLRESSKPVVNMEQNEVPRAK